MTYIHLNFIYSMCFSIVSLTFIARSRFMDIYYNSVSDPDPHVVPGPDPGQKVKE